MKPHLTTDAQIMMRVREDRALVVPWLAAARAGTERETETECVGGWGRREPAKRSRSRPAVA